jgi:hypothetical protein
MRAGGMVCWCRDADTDAFSATVVMLVFLPVYPVYFVPSLACPGVCVFLFASYRLFCLSGWYVVG